MTRSTLRSAALILLCLVFCTITRSQENSTLIINARVADGSSTLLRQTNVRITADHIIEVGNLKSTPADHVIDIHNHSTEGLATDPLAESQISHGITSLVLGADGDSPWPIASYLDERRKNPATLNVTVIVGHATIVNKFCKKISDVSPSTPKLPRCPNWSRRE